MIVKNCTNILCLKTRHAEHMSDHTDSCDLNTKVYNAVLSVSNFQEHELAVCSNKYNSDEDLSLNSSQSDQQLQINSKNMNDINGEFIEKFSELNLENLDVKPTINEVENFIPKIKVEEFAVNSTDQKVSISDKSAENYSNERLPVVKISMKEKDRKPICPNCCKEASHCKKPELNEIENVDRKNLNLPLTQLLIPRSPDRNERKYCKAGLPLSPIKGHCKALAKQQKNNACLNETDMNIKCVLSSAEFLPPLSQQQLHGSGGTYSETISYTLREEMKSFSTIDQDFFLEEMLTPPSSYTDSIGDQFSPSSYEHLSSNSVNNSESYSGDTEFSLSNMLEIYPTPPHSAFENTLSIINDISLQANVNDSSSLISQFNIDDDLSKFPPFEEILTSADVLSPPLSVKTSELDMPSSSNQEEKIKEISWFLKNGSVDPVVAQLVTDYSTDENFVCNSASPNDQDIKKIYTIQESSSQHIKQLPSVAQLPYILPSQSSISVPVSNDSNIVNQLQNNENNAALTAMLLMPIQLQAVKLSGPKDKNRQIPLKPKNDFTSKDQSILPKNEKKEEVKKVDDGRCKVLNNASRTYSVCHEKWKSVKAKINSSLTREQKNELLKFAVQKLTTENEVNLHMAVLTGNEKLIYVIIESRRTKLNNDHSNSKNESNPRISVKEKIKQYVNQQNIHGKTPLHYAAWGENNLLIAYLLECGADPFIRDYENRNTAFHVATVRGDSAIVLIELLCFGRNMCDISEIRNKEGQSILISAVNNHGKEHNGTLRKAIQLIKYLLRKNHRLSSQDSEGRTALHIAVLKKDLELVEVLLTYATDGKAKFILDNEGNSILHLAAKLTNIGRENHYKLIWMIIKYCSELTEIKNKDGKFPYELINENRKEERELLKMKMDKHGFRNL